MNDRNAIINARQLLIISKLSSRRLIAILSNPTDDKRWKVVTILIGLYHFIVKQRIFYLMVLSIQFMYVILVVKH